MAFLDDLASTVSGNPLAVISSVLGIGGTLFGAGSELSPEQEEAFRVLRERLKGIDPKILEMMRTRVRGAIGNEASAVSASTASNLRRQNAPVAKQQEILAELAKKRFGALGSALADIDINNEQYKLNAAQNYAGALGQYGRGTQDYGAGWASLFGAGFNSLLNTPSQKDPFLDERLKNMTGRTFTPLF